MKIQIVVNRIGYSYARISCKLLRRSGYIDIGGIIEQALKKVTEERK